MKTVLLMTYIILISAYNFTLGQWVRTGDFYYNIHTLASNGEYLYAGSEGGGIYVTSNNGTNWAEINNGLASNSAKYVFDIAVISNGAGETKLFAATDAGVFTSTNNGLEWTESNAGLFNIYIRDFAYDSTNIFAATLGGVYFSTNFGANWISSGAGLTNQLISDVEIVDGYLFAAGYESGVFRSSDHGVSWLPVSSGLGGLRIYSLFKNGTDLFTGTEENYGTYISTNFGSMWTAVNSGLTNICSVDFAAYQNNGTSYLFVATGYGVFVSTDNGNNWTESNSGLSGLQIWAVEVCGTDLFAGTIAAGVWRRPLSEMITSNTEQIYNGPTDKFFIYQNFPNPFNPATKIKFSIPKAGVVQIKVFDVLGNEIKTLLNDYKLSGTYDVEFDANSLPGGVYFYRMVSGNYSETKKMILLR